MDLSVTASHGIVELEQRGKNEREQRYLERGSDVSGKDSGNWIWAGPRPWVIGGPRRSEFGGPK